MQFCVHWMSVTVWGIEEYGLKMWDEVFAERLGELHQTEHGGRGFKRLYTSLASAKMYAHPVSLAREGEQDEYFHIELPGMACEAIPVKEIRVFLLMLERYERYNVTRLDLAWDGVQVTPIAFKKAVENGKIRSLAKRETLTYWENTFEMADDGRIGTTSVKLGSRQSNRMVRLYDKRGQVRLEFQMRHERSHMVARDVLTAVPDRWPALAMAHLRDYLDLEIPEWEDFTNEIARAKQTVSNARVIELNRITNWLVTQVSPALSVVADVVGEQSVEALVVNGRRKRGPRYKAVLEAKLP